MGLDEIVQAIQRGPIRRIQHQAVAIQLAKRCLEFRGRRLTNGRPEMGRDDAIKWPLAVGDVVHPRPGLVCSSRESKPGLSANSASASGRHLGSMQRNMPGARTSPKARRIGARRSLPCTRSYPGQVPSPTWRRGRKTACKTDLGQKSGSDTAFALKMVSKRGFGVGGTNTTASVQTRVFVALWKKAASLTGPALPGRST